MQFLLRSLAVAVGLAASHAATVPDTATLALKPVVAPVPALAWAADNGSSVNTSSALPEASHTNGTVALDAPKTVALDAAPMVGDGVTLPPITVANVSELSCLAEDLDAATMGVVSHLTGYELILGDALNVFILLGSLFIAFAGEFFVAPAVWLVGLISGYQLAQMLLAQYEVIASNADFHLWYEPCYFPLITSVVLGLVIATLAMFLTKWLVFFLGAGVGTVAAYELKAFILLVHPGAVESISFLPFWLVAIVIAIVCGLIARWRQTDIFLIATASLGGFGAAFSSRSLLALHGIRVPEWTNQLVFVSVMCFGVIMQCCICRKKPRGARKGGEKPSEPEPALVAK